MAKEQHATSKPQPTIFDALERQALKALLTQFLLRDGYMLPDERRAHELKDDKNEAHAMASALELLGGLRDGVAQDIHDRIELAED